MMFTMMGSFDALGCGIYDPVYRATARDAQTMEKLQQSKVASSVTTKGKEILFCVARRKKKTNIKTRYIPPKKRL
jgi:hypothetical protein